MIESMQAQLQKLEESNRWLRRRMRILEGAMAGLLVVAAVLPWLRNASGESPPPNPPPDWDSAGLVSTVAESIRARRFEVVVGDDDKRVVVLGATEDGHGYVEALTSDGRRSVILGPSDASGAGSVAIHGPSGQQAFRAALVKDSAEMVLGSAGGQPLVRIGPDDKNLGRLTMTNRNGFEVASMGTDAAGIGQLGLSYGAGTPIATMGVGPTGQGQFRLFNEHGARFFDVTVDEARTGRVTVSNMEGGIVQMWPPPPTVDEPVPLPPAPQ